jgi:peptide/nickel transport system permease protein
MVERSASPLRLALSRLWRRPTFRIAAYGVVLLFLAAVYAPFLASETALFWSDPTGARFPILGELFNRRAYEQRHDLLFNLLSLLLPPLAIAWFALRHRWSVTRRLRWSVGMIAAMWCLCQFPLLPAHGRWTAAWDYRPAPTETSTAWASLSEDRRAETTRIFPPVPHRFDATYAGAVMKPPGTRNEATGSRFWLGTDVRGHDVLAQMLFGARISLTIGMVATGLSLLIGTMIGAISGYFGGWTDLLLQRVVEIMMCFPTFILVLAVVAMTSRNIFIIMLVLGLTGWAGTARLVRGEFLAQSVRDYVAASEAIGVHRFAIMFRHILPNALSPLLISATFGIAGMVSAESGLAFLGLGDPNAASWGLLLNQGRENITYAWLIYTPGLAVFSLVMALNLLGNGLREALDPKGNA